MQLLFRSLCYTLCLKLSEIRSCHYTEEKGSGSTQRTGRGGEMVLFPLNLLAAFQQKRGRCRKCRERVEIWGFLAMIGHQELRTGTREARGTGRGRIKHGAGFSPVQGLCSAWRVRGGGQQAEPRSPQIPPESTPGHCVPPGLPGTSIPSRTPLQPPPLPRDRKSVV